MEKESNRLITSTLLTCERTNDKQEILQKQKKQRFEMKKLVGKVTVEEKNEIMSLYERRNGLNELSKVLTADNDALYEKLVKDMGETGTKFQNWWNDMSAKYQWESAEDGNWEINFDTCEIYLIHGTCNCNK